MRNIKDAIWFNNLLLFISIVPLTFDLFIKYTFEIRTKFTFGYLVSIIVLLYFIISKNPLDREVSFWVIIGRSKYIFTNLDCLLNVIFVLYLILDNRLIVDKNLIYYTYYILLAIFILIQIRVKKQDII